MGLRPTRMEVGPVDVETLAAELERTASELEMSVDQVGQPAQDLSEEASTLAAAIDRLQEVPRRVENIEPLHIKPGLMPRISHSRQFQQGESGEIFDGGGLPWTTESDCAGR